MCANYRVFLTVGVAVVAGLSVQAAEPVAIAPGAEVITFRVGGEEVARYQWGPGVAKPYLWPILAPNGSPVTRSWPMTDARPGDTTDHVHQKSAWFCHGDVIPEGIELKTKTADKTGQGVDFWSETKDKESGKPRHGRIVVTRVDKPRTDGPQHAAITTHNDWISPDGVKILEETRTIHLSVLPRGRLFTFDIDLHASVYPIIFGDTKEGSFGVRVNDQIREANKSGGGKLVNAAGQAGEKAVWGYFSDWCDYSGLIDGKAAGVAVFAHPSNPSRSAWHARGYGLLAANPFGRTRAGFPDRKGQTDLVRIDKGQHLKLRFGIYAHDGDVTSGQVAEAFAAFAK